MTKLQWKWLFILALTAGAVMVIEPTVSWYRTPAEERAKREASRERPSRLVNLGLDLLGGTHLLYELDVTELPKDEDVEDAISRQIEVVRNRIDQYGVAEPLIARQGNRWIVVQLPGVKDPDQAKRLIGQTAVLEFRMVDETEGARKVLQKALELGQPFKDGAIAPEAAKLLPPGTTLLPGKEDSYYVVQASAPLTGARLKTARVETGGDYGFPVVAFTFDPQGADVFDKLTSANVGRNMAIVLDGVVYSAPVIKGRIPGGSGIIEGNFDMQLARNLAIVLRAGALPVPMRVIEERTVGPSLGEDSIEKGFLATAVGIAIIFAFFAIYYRAGGLVADVSILANLLFLFAVMAYFRATLTLPGIAGISLNIAMAVDANILVLERIREELAKGKPFRLAVDAGYDLSASAIFDSNLTVLFASLLLFQFGTGPIKGFAVTLTAGNLISMFTATYFTKIFYDSWLTRSPAPAA